jgi:ubiquinone/menaquinone biosynthesis C-methylase UbiE
MSSDTVPLWECPTNIERLAEHVDLAGKRVVDIGAGAGKLVRFLREQGADPIGIECGEAMISQARDADPEHLDAYVEGVGEDLPLDDASVDVAVFSSSLHHVPAEHMAAALGEAERVLRSGGTLVVLEPVAEGPGYEAHRLVDDETEVRAFAQTALDNDLPEAMTEHKTLRFQSSYSYADFAELEHTMVSIDPERRAAFESVKTEMESLFHQWTVEHDGAYWLTQPYLLRIFTKA